MGAMKMERYLNISRARWEKNMTAVVTAGRTLRRFHDATAKLIGDDTLRLQLGALDPVEVVCHGDFAPYNCVFDSEGRIKGIIDFDGARFGPRIWDLSYAIYRFVPLVDFDAPDDGFGNLTTRLQRLRAFFDAYGASREQMIAAVEILPRRRSLFSTGCIERQRLGMRGANRTCGTSIMSSI
jgi:Ser/Thr protein kinase RdoA (MazF antagonist)